ncbi:unnamed protein product [Orchesella dallaii]|uniref:Uncharacterized protein n=1 Tax=Orchesella dallaii TaxID=48710 RepID=A0ABP1RII9_9HEXA
MHVQRFWYPAPVGIDVALLEHEILHFHHHTGGRYLIPWKVSMILCAGIGIVVPTCHNILFLNSGPSHKQLSSVETAYQLFCLLSGIMSLLGSHLTLGCSESIEAVNQLVILLHQQQKRKEFANYKTFLNF